MKTTIMNEAQRKILTLCKDLTDAEKELVLQKIIEIKNRRKSMTA